ncbi:MAG TPA: alpha/beta hydrolase, partial [Lachnospiraceae bacterium]|nr:alpha/beta hydrolase [Lachnospiraceae bacterium]
MSKTSDLIRDTFGSGDTERDRGLTSPPDVVRYDNILYGPDPKWNVLDVYRPKRSEGRDLPVIVSVHGGGWVYGDKDRYQFYCMELSRRGFAVVNFSYRLAPEAVFPAALEDTNRAFEWMLNNAGRFGFDT